MMQRWGPPESSPAVDRRRQMRHNPTDAERALWRLLRHRQLAGVKFRRQHPIGPYILDFYCLSEGLAVEVDGGQHFESDGEERDAVRTRFPALNGVRVLRFSDRDVLKESSGVLEAIVRTLESPSP